MIGLRLTRALLAVALGLCLPISAAAQEVVEYYGTDAIGSVRIVFDASGGIVGRMDYGPFGEQVAVSTVGHKSYAGLFRDGEAGLDYAEARSYQVRTGRFNAPDPVYAGQLAPQLWNRYAYAANNPISLTDTTGLYIEDQEQNNTPQRFKSGVEADYSSLTLIDAWQTLGNITFGGYEGTQRSWSTFAIDWEKISNRIDETKATVDKVLHGGECRLPESLCPKSGLLEELNGVETTMAGVPSSAAVAAVATATANIAKLVGPQAANYARTAAQFPNKVAKFEWHHIMPQYLGGAKDGLQVLLRADYHQAITNAFRQAQAYGQKGPAPTDARLAGIMSHVYRLFPLPPGPHRP